MLNGTLCSTYDNRPHVCRSFPHLEQPHFTSRLIGVIDNVAICPISFNAFEELKRHLDGDMPSVMRCTMPFIIKYDPSDGFRRRLD
jgi:hypothetical protein